VFVITLIITSVILGSQITESPTGVKNVSGRNLKALSSDHLILQQPNTMSVNKEIAGYSPAGLSTIALLLHASPWDYRHNAYLCSNRVQHLQCVLKVAAADTL
jgi:hypothetical protein